MSLYAIGDLQGCRACLEALLQRIEHDPGRDRLWFVGDLVNRGPDSLGTLRRVRDLSGAAFVLGNHDLHLLAVAAGARATKRRDSFQDILQAPDRDELLAWLAARPLLETDNRAGWVMVHAGLPPCWDIAGAQSLAARASASIQAHLGDRDFFESMYGDEPACWDTRLKGWDRLRYVINALTRMRFCDERGCMDFSSSGPPGTQPAPYRPWYELWPHRGHRLVFGHWAALGAGEHGRAVSTDSGCVWGNRLTAVRLDPGPTEFFSVGCAAD